MSVPQRKSADWMMKLDERILEQVESDGWTTPGMLAQEPGFPEYEGIISDRCKRLRYVGFLDTIHDDMYEITGEGHLYLRGEIDASHRPHPKASAVFDRWDFAPGWEPGPLHFRVYDSEGGEWLNVRATSGNNRR